MQIVPAPEASTQQAAIEAKTPKGSEREQMIVLLQSGLFPRLGEYSNVGSESGKGKIRVVQSVFERNRANVASPNYWCSMLD